MTPTPAPWTDNEALLALIAELVDQTNRLLQTVYSKKGATIPKPIRIPRPGQHRPKPLPMSDPRARAFFGGYPVHYEPAAGDTTNGDAKPLT